ncbi:cytochrome P450 [Streptomyces chryseus]|uniref:Cytochrome P450 121 n=1 Tax=Streptomyces chryseus TaxID=68186 RepID=A0ABQ3DHV2_9ACTN|nr:cytochrome P450 [Streptomyces chryseus]GHA92509.1 cytochrome P450 121 [Streptomyces chryseus]
MSDRLLDFPLSRRGDVVPEEGSWLRGQQPVARVRTLSGDMAWLVTSCPLARKVLEDERFALGGTAAPGPYAHTVAPRAGGDAGAGLRGAVMKALNPRTGKGMHGWLRITADRLIDDLMAWGPPVDLRAGFADPFSAALHCKILGVPFEDWPRLMASLDVAFMTSAQPFEGSQLNWYKDVGYMVERLNAPASERSGLLGELAALREDPRSSHLTDEMLATVAASLFGAGAVSTSAFLARAMLALLRRPQLTAYLKDRPDRMARAVDELLRGNLSVGDGPTRLALADVHLGDVLVRKGELVLVLVEGATFDAEVFEHPEILHLNRAYNPHLAFGGGRHLCPASALGRAHARTALTALLERMPRLGLAVPEERLVWRTGLIKRLPERLPVLW